MRRSSVDGPREAHRAWLVDLDELCGSAADGWFAGEIARLDAGETVRCRAYEVDLHPPLQVVEIDGDGHVTLLDSPASQAAAGLSPATVSNREADRLRSDVGQL